MRKWVLAAVAGAALLGPASGAQAAWKSYISRELGFSFRAPGEIKTGVGAYRSDVAGSHQTVVYSSTDDDIEYKVTVMSFSQAQAGESATILGERESLFQDGRTVLMDAAARVENGKKCRLRPQDRHRPAGSQGTNDGRVLLHQGKARVARSNRAAGEWRLRLARSRPVRRFHHLRGRPHGTRRDRACDPQAAIGGCCWVWRAGWLSFDARPLVRRRGLSSSRKIRHFPVC